MPTEHVWMVVLLSDPAEVLVPYSMAPAIQSIRITLVLYWKSCIKLQSHSLVNILTMLFQQPASI